MIPGGPRRPWPRRIAPPPPPAAGGWPRTRSCRTPASCSGMTALFPRTALTGRSPCCKPSSRVNPGDAMNPLSSGATRFISIAPRSGDRAVVESLQARSGSIQVLQRALYILLSGRAYIQKGDLANRRGDAAPERIAYDPNNKVAHYHAGTSCSSASDVRRKASAGAGARRPPDGQPQDDDAGPGSQRPSFFSSPPETGLHYGGLGP
jgi:hypothetical protein